MDDLLYEWRQHNADTARVQNLLKTSRAYDLFNDSLSWTSTRQGWNFWANISHAWKCTLFTHHLFEDNDDESSEIIFWETRSGGFTPLPMVTSYMLQHGVSFVS